MQAFLIQIVILLLIYLIVAVSLNLTLGQSGLLNLGHLGFFGIGAYVSAIASKTYGLSFFFAFLLAASFSALCGFALMSGIKKLSGNYLALATLGFNYVVYTILVNWMSFTGGPVGISGIPRPSFFGWKIATQPEYLFLSAMVSFLIFFFIAYLSKSRFGKVLNAVRDDELAAMALGKNTHKVKVQAMMLSAAFCGVAGSLFAHFITFIDPSLVSVTEVIFILSIVILGGIADNRGTLLATGIIVSLPEALRFVHLPNSAVGPLRQMIFSLILILILLYRPKGLFGKVELK